MAKMSVEKKAALILAGFMVSEGAIVMLSFLGSPAKFMAYIGFADGRHGAALGWLLALAVTVAYVVSSLHLPSVRANLVRPSMLKLLALPMALFAGILEEAVFRGALMDHLARQGSSVAVQILLSGLTFGLAHGIWGLFGKSLRATLGATFVTGVLGAALAVVYLASGRLLMPCIAAHFIIDALIEPGIVLAACRGEMNRLRSAVATDREGRREKGS
ncbi:MAG TPA: CPBP family intramembrane glutamic endopeptidase [Gammaproteobacteria bacterium]|nr:CPBP family intramembrane glutamic endopeptidase [Gammaproteobacteria bacterium]